MKKTQAVGIDLGTTYSSLAVLNTHGQPVTIPNADGELSTPSVVYFENGEVVVGTEALRNAVAAPDRVIQHAKRYLGNPQKYWEIDGQRHTPLEVSSLILRKLLKDAEPQLGKIREAVITVPALFTETQRQQTLDAGHAAGLERIQMINEPVAAALCHVLGDEGLAFVELAVDQKILVFDLGGGTLDLAVVDYRADNVRVVASGGNPLLGGLDWTQILIDLAAGRFLEETGIDPRQHRGALQYLSLEAEQAKRSLSARDRAAVSVQHRNQLKTYQIGKKGFELASAELLQKCEQATSQLLSGNSLGWAHIGTVLVTGGASRMPMVRELLQKMSGRTLNRTLSPDQSIAHGAASYAGMLLSGDNRAQEIFSGEASRRLAAIQQQSVNARPLGVMVRDHKAKKRVPCFLIRANTPLPTAVTHVFGTAGPDQKRIRVRIVEGGIGDQSHVEVGECTITNLPENLPEGSRVEVTLSYDVQARINVTAREVQSGQQASAELRRPDNLTRNSAKSETGMATPQIPKSPRDDQHALPQRASGEQTAPEPAHARADGALRAKPDRPRRQASEADRRPRPKRRRAQGLNAFDEDLLRAMSDATDAPPVFLCHRCGKELETNGDCADCGSLPEQPAENKTSQKSPRASVDVLEDEFWDADIEK